MQDDSRSDDTTVMLGLLSAVERDSGVTQRSLSRELGIALGLANAYLKRCVNKGLIKVRQAPLNRYAYYLTPGGFAEKSRLTAEYLTVSLNFFRNARHQCGALLADCARHGRTRIALAGAGELAEIAVLSANDTKVGIICVIDLSLAGQSCAGLPVVRDLAAAEALAGGTGYLHAVVVTDVRAPQATFEAMKRAAEDLGLDGQWVLAPDLLRISEQPAMDDGEEVRP